MSRGAKPGQNRFEAAQRKHRQARTDRIKDELIPKLKAYVGKISFDGITPYSRFCAELYNEIIPVNEKPIGYRTFVQNTAYWSLVGPLYYKHWDSSSGSEINKERLIRKLATRRADSLEDEIEKLRLENEALRSALRSHGATTPSLTTPVDKTAKIHECNLRFDKICRALNLVLEASEGTFVADTALTRITCAFDPLEPKEGLVPKEIAEPFITWLKEKRHY
jgi:hypothetical protein